MYFAVEIHLLSSFKHLENPLFGEGRSKDDREVNKRSHTAAYGILKCVYDLLALVFYEVPFVYHKHAALAVAHYQVEYVHILGFHTGSGVYHKDADI